MANEMVKYALDNGQEMKLDSATVKNYLVSGGGNVTDQEVLMYLKLCAAKRLNPFLRESYLIKFGNSPATIVTGKDYFTKKANQNPCFDGFEAGVIVTNGSGDVIERAGTLVMKSEELLGGWATVYRKDRRIPIKNSAMLSEYLRYKNDGTVMANWKSMPATMIRKVALVQSLREAFPEDFGGMYSPDEMPVDGANLPDKPIEVTWDEVPTADIPPEAMSTLQDQKTIHIEATNRLKWSDAKLKANLKKEFGTEHTAELTDNQAKKLVAWFKKQPKPKEDPAEQQFNQMADQQVEEFKQEMEPMREPGE